MVLRTNPGDGRGALIEPESYPYSPTLTVNAAALFARIILAGDILLNRPINGADGVTLSLLLFADGTDCNVSFDNSITLSQFGGDFYGPILIESGTTLFVTLQYDGSRGKWVVPSLMAQY